MDINNNQIKAIEHFTGPCMVLAGPGSGKTFVITKRIENLINKHNVNPNNILVITFTRFSADEMKNRFINLIKDKKISLLQIPHFGTFHSIFFSILKEHFGYNADSLITEQEEKEYLMNIIENDKSFKNKYEYIDLIIKDIKEYKLSKEKNEYFIPKSLTKHKFDEIYKKYKDLLYIRKKLDFHDMIEICSEMLSTHKDVLEFYREKYKYILIDEFQDINKEQFDIIKLIAKDKNIFVVGDDDQSIYKFRGSRPKVMFDFKNEFPNSKIIILNVNYRCAKNIVAFSTRVINQNKERFLKELKSQRDVSGLVHIKVFEDLEKENEYIVNIIKENIKKYKDDTDIAILYRTNILSINIIQKLQKENIDFYIKDSNNNFFEHFAIKDIISYLKIIALQNNTSDYINIINKPLRYISRNAFSNSNCDIKYLQKYYQNNIFILKYLLKLENDINRLKNINITLAIREIRYNIGYEDYLKNYCLKKSIDYDEIKEVLDFLEEESIKFKTINNFLSYVDEYSNIYKVLTKSSKDSKIKLMTFHSSKGLEFKNVIILDANDGLIPHKKSLNQKDIESERRLFYVALTRSKDNLYILFTKNRNGKIYKPSRFIIEGIGGENGSKEKSFSCR